MESRGYDNASVEAPKIARDRSPVEQAIAQLHDALMDCQRHAETLMERAGPVCLPHIDKILAEQQMSEAREDITPESSPVEDLVRREIRDVYRIAGVLRATIQALQI